MPRVELTVYPRVSGATVPLKPFGFSGAAPNLTAGLETVLSDGHYFANTPGKVYLMVSNAHADGTATITFNVTTTVTDTYQGSTDPLLVADRTVTVGPGLITILGPFSANVQNSGNVEFDVTVAGGTANPEVIALSDIEVVPFKVQ